MTGRSRQRALASAVGIVVVLLTVWGFRVTGVVDLTVILLVVMLEIVAIAAIAGPWFGVATAFVALAAVNWWLVPPYGTFEIASLDNLVALAVFGLAAVAAALVVEATASARARAEREAARSALVAEVLEAGSGGEVTSAQALERVRDALELRGVVLLRDDVSTPLLIAGEPEPGPPSLHVRSDDYVLEGWGDERIAPDRAYLRTLASAASRAFESERLELERRRAEQLQVTDEVRSMLLRSLGHDLRTPLAGIRVSADALDDPHGTLSADDRRELQQSISRSTQRLDDIVTNLLDLSRVEAGARAVHCAPCDFEEVLDRALLTDELPPITTDVPPELPLVVADSALLERILVNLLTNVARHAQGSAARVTASVTDGTVLVSVVDHGPGIAPDERQAATTAFARVGVSTTDGGAHLGLATARGFAEAMGSDLHLAESPGGGLTVQLKLPVAPGGDGS